MGRKPWLEGIRPYSKSIFPLAPKSYAPGPHAKRLPPPPPRGPPLHLGPLIKPHHLRRAIRLLHPNARLARCARVMHARAHTPARALPGRRGNGAAAAARAPRSARAALGAGGGRAALAAPARAGPGAPRRVEGEAVLLAARPAPPTLRPQAGVVRRPRLWLVPGRGASRSRRALAVLLELLRSHSPRALRQLHPRGRLQPLPIHRGQALFSVSRLPQPNCHGPKRWSLAAWRLCGRPCHHPAVPEPWRPCLRSRSGPA